LIHQFNIDEATSSVDTESGAYQEAIGNDADRTSIVIAHRLYHSQSQ
jgi:ABC-type multidrug transport system fused ATPase/permease subunit